MSSKSFVGVKRVAIDWVSVGMQHAAAEWERAKQSPGWGMFEPLALVQQEPDVGALQAIYGLVAVEDWGTYRDAYRSTLHGLNLGHEAQQRSVRRRMGVRAC